MEEEKNEVRQFRINGKTYIDKQKEFPASAFGDIFLVKDNEGNEYILKKATTVELFIVHQ